MKHRSTVLTLTAIAVGALAIKTVSRADMIDERFAQFDTNHDGVISGDELKAAPYLPKLDLNGDGKVTLEEAREALTKFRGAIVEKVKEKMSQAGGKGEATDVVFKRLDTNNDGKLTPDELKDKTWFAKLDTNKDGFVTLEEARKVIGEFLPKGYEKTGDAGAASKFAETEDAALKEQPQILKPADHGVGRLVPDVALKDSKDHAVKLSSFAGSKALVVGLFSASCPISNKLAPELARLEKDYRDKGVNFVWVSAIPTETAEDTVKFVTEHELKSPSAKDAEGLLTQALQATTTTEVFVLDTARTLIYRGAVNDQYGLGYAKDAAKKAYLRDALEALLAGKTIDVAATTAPGCALDLKKMDGIASSPVTYHHQVARIVQNNCAECHHKDGIGPFSLETMKDVVEHAGMIKKQIDRGAMPPWFAKVESGQNSPFINDCSLSAQDKTDMLAWLNSDRPAGNPADAPVARKFTGAWSIGEPDAVFEMTNAIAVKAEGTMPYQSAVVETSFSEDRWVSAYEIVPSQRQVVHHVIVGVHAKGEAVKARGEGAEGFWAAYVPGNSHRVLPEGFAKLLPAGAKISFQIHYTPNGKAVDDKIKIGLKFAKEPTRYTVHVTAIANPRLNIPAGEANHVETAQRTIPADMMLTAYMAHMHVRGKAFKYEVTYPDGKNEVLLDIPRYDFNWQLQYDLAKPKRIPAGSTVKITAVFDNSSGNPANPDPTKNVRWGQQTYDEMMIGYVEHYTLAEPVKVAVK